ncbi:MAG: M1 family metallopeptidase, partial [Candidatus Saccharimonadales bacterium]
LLGKVPKSTKTIVLHGSKLDIASALVNNQPAEVKVLADSQEIELNLDKTIAADTEVEVAIKYSSEIRDNMYGLYRSKFKDEEGEEQTILTTQFEANHARDMLPCVDEPEAKAVFHLSITAPEGLSTVSNTEVVSVDSKDGESTTNFAPTPKMSTYLLAIVVGELAYLEGKTKDGVRVRVYATSSNVEHTKFALECATATLEFFNRYFDIPYPLEKCDLLALPDFAAGAMENWGCITFREQALLVDEENTSFAVKQYVADVVAHELAHQWFGNLVTMQWWNDLWLNEGFATWVARLAVDEMFPEWKIWEDFVVEDVLRALSLDGLSNSHPIEVEVKDPDEIDEIFDAISYSKGAAVIHMLHSYLGADDFRHGLQNYLKANSLSNTTTNDLWQSLEETSQKPVAKFMSSWTKQTGYPLISYEKTDSGLKVNQARFLLLKQSDIQPQTWHVPISLANYPDKQFLLDKTSANFDIKIDGAPKFNPGQNSFYRTLYQPDDLQQISSSLADMEALDCINIIDDAFELSEAGRQKLVDVIPL